MHTSVSLIVVFLIIGFSIAVEMSSKTVKQVLRKPNKHWVGDGFHVIPVFADKAFTQALSPFLMFDYAAPKKFEPTEQRRGVGQHPHRGFETVTIAFEGEVEHADSKGNTGVIGSGDVQWMSAARGIVHEEYHSRNFAKRGGFFEMCQIWVNLPASKKMNEPRYQPILDKQIPKVQLVSRAEGDESKSEDPLAEGYVRVIAGEFGNVKGPAETQSPINMWDVKLVSTGKRFDFDISDGHNTVVFVRKGSISVQDAKLNEQDVAIITMDGSTISITAETEDSLVLILSGEPFDEPIAARGPFVMNTQTELREAMSDFQMGRNGF